MPQTGQSPLAAALLGLVLMTGLTACDTVPVTAYYSNYGVGYDDYYYYPTAGIYFQPYTGFYFYPSGSTWVSVRTLPSRYRIDDRYRVVVKHPHGRPWAHQHQHRKCHGVRHHHRIDPVADRRERERNRELYMRLHRR
jgi:hypothetical protein